MPVIVSEDGILSTVKDQHRRKRAQNGDIQQIASVQPAIPPPRQPFVAFGQGHLCQALDASQAQECGEDEDQKVARHINIHGHRACDDS